MINECLHIFSSFIDFRIFSKLFLLFFSISPPSNINIFFNSIKDLKPFITLKIASTADGKIATNLYESKWITNSTSRMFGHKLRSLNECLIVGTGTIRKDNPILDCRLEGLSERSPDIFVLDRRLDLKHNLKIFSNKNRRIYIFYSDKTKKKILNSKNIKYIKIKEVNNVLDIKTIIKKISKLGYMRILVEGGAKLSASLLENNLIDEITWFRASKIMGSNGISAISDLNISHILIGFAGSEMPGNFTISEQEAYEEASEILTLISGSLSFEELALEKSDDPGVSGNKGNLGWISWGKVDPEFQKQVYQMKRQKILNNFQKDTNKE